MSTTEKQKSANDLTLEKDSFIELLGNIMKHNKNLQNNYPSMIPQEDLVCEVVEEYLKPYVKPQGPLTITKHSYTEGRSNLIIQYPPQEGNSDKVISFVGSHMDVVPAVPPEEWDVDPFKLTVKGDKLLGRGVTDCLGHVACLSNLFKQLAENKIKLDATVVGVFIANEEGSQHLGVGIDEMAKRGVLEELKLKNGPLLWVDSANFGPTIASGGMVAWELTATGKKFHSGFPHKAINPITLATQAVAHIQKEFYKKFPLSAADKEYLFDAGSSMKPTQIKCPQGSINQIPLTATVSGDIRITPFTPVADIQRGVEEIVKTLNDDLSVLETWGYESFALPEEKLVGKIELKWVGGEAMKGVAVDLKSPGYTALKAAIADVRGEAKPFSLTGSLPIIADLKEQGLDVQITGFGRMDGYHAINEYAMLSEYVQGMEICAKWIHKLAGK